MISWISIISLKTWPDSSRSTDLYKRVLVRNSKFLEHLQWHIWKAALGQGSEIIGKLLNMHYAAIRQKMPFPRSPYNLLLPSSVPFSASCLKLSPWSQRWSTSLRRYKNTGMLHTEVVHELQFLPACIQSYGPSSSAEILRRGAEELLSGVVGYQASQGTCCLQPVWAMWSGSRESSDKYLIILLVIINCSRPASKRGANNISQPLEGISICLFYQDFLYNLLTFPGTRS